MTFRTVAIAFITGLSLPILAIYSISHNLLGPAFFWETDAPSSSLAPVPLISPADPHVLATVRRGLEKYRDTRPYKDDWVIRIDDAVGTIETNWYHEHKGEVQVKTQVRVWGNQYRVDTWQRVGWVVPTVHKTERTRREEIAIQDAIATEFQSTQ
jgi:hypothetical protein